MIVLNVTYSCTAEVREEFLKRLHAEGIDEACRSEDGNFKYDYYLPENGSDELLLVEKWRDAEALRAHGEQPHFIRLAQIKNELQIPTVINKYFVED